MTIHFLAEHTITAQSTAFLQSLCQAGTFFFSTMSAQMNTKADAETMSHQNHNYIYFIEITLSYLLNNKESNNQLLDTALLTNKLSSLRNKFAFKQRIPFIALIPKDSNIGISQHSSIQHSMLLCGFDDILQAQSHHQEPQALALTKKFIAQWLPQALDDKNLSSTQNDSNPNYSIHNHSTRSDWVQNRQPKHLLQLISALKIDKDLIDAQECLHLANNNQGLANDLLFMMLSSLPAIKKEFEKLYNANNITSIADIVHKLKGSCCYCGTPQLRKACQEFDAALKLKENEKTTLDTKKNQLIHAITALILIKQKTK